MAQEKWHVVVEGAQLPGEHDTAQVRELLSRSKGQDVKVWAPGMASWTDPRTLAQFKEQAPEPKPSAPERVPEPPPRPAAPQPSHPADSPGGPVMRISADEARARVEEQAGVFKALLDTSFNHLLTPKLIKAVYIVFMVLLGLLVAGGILTSLAGFRAGFARGLVGLVISIVVMPLVAVLYLAMVRMGLEMMMAIFKIKEYTGILAEKARRPE